MAFGKSWILRNIQLKKTKNIKLELLKIHSKQLGAYTCQNLLFEVICNGWHFSSWHCNCQTKQHNKRRCDGKSQIKSRLRRRGLERNSSIFKKQFALILEPLPKKGMQSKQDGVKFYAKLYKCICLMGKHIYLNYWSKKKKRKKY